MRKSITLVAVLFTLVGCARQPTPPAPVEPVKVNQEPAQLPAAPVPDPPKAEQQWVSEATFADPAHGWVVLNQRTVLATTDGGNSWHEIYESPLPIRRLQFASDRKGWAFEGDQIVTSADGGHSWQRMPSEGPTFSSIGLVFGNPTWAADSARLYSSADHGSTWTQVATPCQQSTPAGFSFVTTNMGWVICTGEVKGIGWLDKQLYKTDDAGLTWTLMASGGYDVKDGALPGGYLGGLFFLDDRHGWYSQVRNGALFATSDGGRSWRQVPGLGGEAVTGIHFVSLEFGSVLNMNASPFRLMTTSDGGQTWTQRYP